MPGVSTVESWRLYGIMVTMCAMTIGANYKQNQDMVDQFGQIRVDVTANKIELARWAQTVEKLGDFRVDFVKLATNFEHLEDSLGDHASGVDRIHDGLTRSMKELLGEVRNFKMQRLSDSKSRQARTQPGRPIAGSYRE